MDLSHLQAHMESFYLCSHLPIRAFNNEGIELLCTGFSSHFLEFTHALSHSLKEVLPFLLTQKLVTITPKEDVYFTLCPAKQHTLEEGIYVIGPYTSNLNLRDRFLFKPMHCMPHLITLLYTLSCSVTPSAINDVTMHLLPKKNTGSEDYSYHVAKAEHYIRTHYEEPITLEALAQHLNLNKSYLCTIFKKVTKDSFCNYTNKVRIEESKKLLKNTNDSMLDIALAVGFSSASYFNTIFKKLEGKTPLEYRKSI